MSDEQRCECCGQLMYEDGRSGVQKHYVNDLAQCPVAIIQPSK